MTESLYPWTVPLWEKILDIHHRLPHGLLICGPRGTGKLDLAFALAKTELCTADVTPSADKSESEIGCNECRSCTLFDAGNHPDFHFLTTEAAAQNFETARLVSANRHLPERPKSRKLASSIIAVDRIRSLHEQLITHAFGKNKFALLGPADGMNTQAANALLKMLEEPPTRTRMVLVSDQISRLPLTVRSRTTRLDVSAPTTENALIWLKSKGIDEEIAKRLLSLSRGPVRALELYREGIVKIHDDLQSTVSAILNNEITPIESALKWSKLAKDNMGPEELIPILRTIIDDIVRQAADRETALSDELRRVIPRLSLKKLHRAALELSALSGIWDMVLDDTLVLEQAFSAIQVARRD